MPLGVNAHPDAWMDGVQVNAQDLRLQTVAAHLTGASPSGSTGIAARPGVRYGTGNPLQVNASSGMNITVNAGTAWVQGTASATAGVYTCCLDTTSTLTVATSDPTNPRIDNVICQVTDNGNNTSTTVVTLQTGTAAPSPVAPTLPANSLLLATVAVGAAVASITAGNITDGRVFTAATGGIVPMASTSGGITGQAGLYAHDLTSGRLKVSDGAGNARAPKTAAFVPVSSSATSVTVNNTLTNILNVSITVDGSTEIEISASWAGIDVGTSSVGNTMTFGFDRSGSGLGTGSQWSYQRNSTGTGRDAGGSYRFFTTPAAGSYTINFTGQASANTFSVFNPILRVGPAFG